MATVGRFEAPIWNTPWMSFTVGGYPEQPEEIWHPSKRTTPECAPPEWWHTAVTNMADGQPSALGTGCHPGSETSVWLPREQTLYVHAAQPHAIWTISWRAVHISGEIPSKDDIAEMEGRSVRWMSAVADTIWWWLTHSGHYVLQN